MHVIASTVFLPRRDTRPEVGVMFTVLRRGSSTGLNTRFWLIRSMRV